MRPGPLTVDFKEGGKTATIAECAAAMANAQGGLIFVGITEQGRDIVGVPRETMAHVADVLATYLESPDWTPEMIEVPLGDDKPGQYVLVIRVNRDTAPRPVFVQGRGGRFWAPVRMPGSTRQATRDEHMLADPALDLSDPAERAEQVDRWLSQIGSDAGLLGMEDLVAKMRGPTARNLDCLPFGRSGLPNGFQEHP